MNIYKLATNCDRIFNMMRFLFILILPVLLLSGCASAPAPVVYQQLDLSEKTIMVPPGSQGLLGELKKCLAKNKWKMKIYRGAVVAEKETDKKSVIYDTFLARYRLLFTGYIVDFSVRFKAMYSYDLSIVDNKTGDEVITMSSPMAEWPSVVRQFDDALNNKVIE